MGEVVMLRNPVQARAGYRLIFAFDLLMGEAMRELCGSARLLSPARLANLRLSVNSDGHVTVIPRTGANVHGVVWEIVEAEVAQLADLLGRSKRVERFKAVVRSPAGRRIEVEFFAPANHREGMGSSALVKRLRQLTEHHGFPEIYGAMIGELGPGLVEIPPWLRL